MSFVRIPFRILACLLRPPWGIMLLVSGIIVASVAYLGQSQWDNWQSQSLYFQLEKSKVNQKEAVARQLTQFDAVGMRLLVRGLASKEEATALTCHQTLKQQLSEWQNLPNDQAAQRYLVFSKELAESSKNGTLYGQQLAQELAVMVQNDILNRGFEGQHLVSENCQKVIDAWQAGRPDQTMTAKSNQQTGYVTTLVGAGEPRNARVSGINVPYLVAQKTNTDTNDRSQQLSNQRTDTPSVLPDDDISNTKNQTTQTTKPATSPRVGFYSLYSPTPAPQRNNPTLIARDKPKNSPFLTERLQQVTLRDLPKLPTQDLMRLLNHTSREISHQAEAILKKRDGFQEEHVRLAGKLYHPDTDVRKSLLPLLADNDQLETYSWLSELLKDPEQEVRLATAKAISTQIPLDDDELLRLQQIMQSDTDPRIAALGRGLETRVY